jgi:O-antigen ligase
MGTFPLLVSEFDPGIFADLGSMVPHAHNHFLQAAVDLGLPGGLAYLAIWMVAARLVVRAWKGASGRWNYYAIVGLTASLLAYFIYGITDVVPLGDPLGLPGWALLSLLVAYTRLASEERVAATESGQPPGGR